MSSEIDPESETPAVPDGDHPFEALNVGGGAIAAVGASEDLSSQIARTVTRSPGEQVTCRRVGDHHYRCNWWVLENTRAYDNPAMLGSLVTTSRIGRSEFLHVVRTRSSGETRTGGGLRIDVISRR
jgi:hypothetical protein